jgi:hypothetical protein
VANEVFAMRLFELFNANLKEEGLIVPGVNTTKDVQPGEIRRQAAKLGHTVTDTGVPPLMRSDGKFNKPTQK